MNSLHKTYGRRFLALTVVLAIVMLTTTNTAFSFESYSYNGDDAYIALIPEHYTDPNISLDDEYEVADEKPADDHTNQESEYEEGFPDAGDSDKDYDEDYTEYEKKLETERLFVPFSTPAFAGSQLDLEAALLIPNVHITLTNDFNVNGPVIIPAGISAIITGAGHTISVISGGGFFVPSGAELVLESINLVNSNSPLATGLVVTGGTATIADNSLISGFTNSGARVQSFGTLTMTGGTISGNTAQEGSGVRIEWGGTFIMEGGEISGNNTLSPWGGGGGVFVGGFGLFGDTTSFIMTGGEISGNTTGWNGGGVFVHGGGVGNIATFTMTGGKISGNTAGVFGGGVRMESGSIFIMEDGEISGNIALGTGAAQGGGGVAVTESEFILEGGAISGNTAQRGGGVIVATNSTFIMEGGSVSGNTAQLNGGGVFVDWNSNFTMRDSTISRNKAANNGGGIFAANYTNLTIRDTAVFSGNTASSAHDFYQHPSFTPGGTVPAGSSGGDGAIGGSVANINWALNSIGGTHLLNNYDINYVGFPITTQNITFNPNSGIFIGENQLPARLISGIGTYASAFDAYCNLVNPNLPHPTKTGYIFGGWFDSQINANGTTQTGRVLYTDSVTDDTSRTLWARWMPLMQNIYFDPNGGVFTGADQLPTRMIPITGGTYASAFDAYDNLVNPYLAHPSRIGYLFGGWFDSQINANGTTQAGRVLYTDPVTDDTTRYLWARWKPIDDGSGGNNGSDYDNDHPAGSDFITGGFGPGGSVYSDGWILRRPPRPRPRPSQLHPRPPLENRPELPHIPSDIEDYDKTPYIERFRRHFVSGYPDGTFQPDGPMTRAEMIQVFFNISPVTQFHATETRFLDICTSDWFFEAVAYLENSGIIQGFPDGSLRPNEPITNAEFSAMTVKFFNLTNLIEPDLLIEAESHWGANYVNIGFARGWFEYFGITQTFDPDAPIPRAQAVTLLNFYQRRVPCPDAINTFLVNTNRLIFPDLSREHWSFYEVMEAAFTRYYYFNPDGTETWLYILN